MDSSKFWVGFAIGLITVVLQVQSIASEPPATRPLAGAILLWPGGAPGSEGQSSPEIDTQQTERATASRPAFSYTRATNINFPSITPFLSDAKLATGAAVIVAPGGGHQFLSIDHEGYDVARWLADHGVAAFVLKYRLAKAPGSTYKVEVHALMDMQRAIRTVRANASQYGIDPHRAGVMGFSAGGELAILASTRYEHPVAGSSDATDALECRPDFQALLYPGGLNDPDAVKVDAQTPPAFMACAADDRPTISQSLPKLYLNLRVANVHCALFIYSTGGHGFGIRPSSHAAANWPNEFLAWMKDQEMLNTR